MDGRELRRADASWPATAARGPGIEFGVTVGRLATRTRETAEVLDLTERVAAFVEKAALEAGWVNVQSRHTTAGIVVNENEPGLLQDALALLERLAPRGIGYAHDALHLRPGVPLDERPNGHSHAKALLLRTAETVNVASGRLQLGTWQRVLLVELDGPRDREISLLALGERRR
jgi:secondary thiamine-phosphate synthase enzyme